MKKYIREIDDAYFKYNILCLPITDTNKLRAVEFLGNVYGYCLCLKSITLCNCFSASFSASFRPAISLTRDSKTGASL